jgi:hypothetical protein
MVAWGVIRSGDRWLLGIGVASVVAVLAAVPHVPFVDLPNHSLVLQMARDFRAGQQSPYFEPAGELAFTYTLFARLDWLLSPLMPVAAAVRLMVIAAVAGLPLAVWALARRLTPAGAAWAGVLALPLAVSWPAQIGLLSYVLGMPPALLAGAWAIDACAAGTWPRRAGRAALVAAALLVAYLAHPMTLVLGALLVALAWFTFGTPRASIFVLLAATALPVAALLAWDVTQGRLELTAGVVEPLRPEGPRRPLARAALQLFTYGLHVQVWSDLVWKLPFAAALVGLTALGARRPPGVRAGIHGGAAALVMVLLALFTPSAVPGAMFVCERIAAFALAVVAIPAGWGMLAAPRAARLAALAAVALALGHALAAIHRDAAEVAGLVGARPPASLEGRYLAIIADCAPRPDPFPGRVLHETRYHLWAHAVHPTRGYMPYAFATRRYQAARHRRGEFYYTPGPAFTRGATPEACERSVERRLADSLLPRARDYAGALVIGERPLLERLVSKRPEERRWIGPGMVALTRIPGRGL